MNTSSNMQTQRMTAIQFITILICFLMNILDAVDVLVISYTASSIAKDWHITPEMLGLVFSGGLFGMTVGALVLAPIADRIGRKKIILISALLMGISISATFYSEDLYELITLRFISGLGIGAMLASTATLVSEYAPKNSKNFWISFSLSGYPIGAFLSGLVSAKTIPLYGWQSMYIIAGITTILTVPLIYFFLAPSIEFLVKKRPPNALDKINKVLVKMKFDLLENMPLETYKPNNNSIAAILSKEYKWNTLKLWVAFFTSFATLYFLVSWIPKLAENAGLSLTLAIYAGSVFNLGAFGGIVIQGYLSSRFKIQYIIALFLTLSAILMIIFQFFIGSDIVLLMFGMIGFSIQGGFVGLYSIGTLLYPTEFRSTGVGWSIGAGRGGAVIGPMLGGILIGIGFSFANSFVIFSIPLFVASILTLSIKIGDL